MANSGKSQSNQTSFVLYGPEGTDENLTTAQSWVPSIKNPYLGSVNWTVPENVEITVTLFRDSRQEEYEDKEWTFVIEDQTANGRRKILASKSINMKNYASHIPSQTNIKVKLKPATKKVVSASITLTLSCVFLREGKATDEDMQSVASLMSIGKADIGNLDDLDEDEEDDDNLSAKINEMASQYESHLSDTSNYDNPFDVPEFEEEEDGLHASPPLFEKCKPERNPRHPLS
ncbi:EH domain-binding protein 1-like [Liolophura sinensis]|uniref:EH domain-binding protein 1-like n=1 Tax=Liolophura sinensis TaxID=3198878 RepID=UPI003158F52F